MIPADPGLRYLGSGPGVRFQDPRPILMSGCECCDPATFLGLAH